MDGGPTDRHLVVVNLSDERADGMVRWPDVPAGPLTLVDLLSGETFERDGTAIAADGLYVALDGWAATILRAPDRQPTTGRPSGQTRSSRSAPRSARCGVVAGWSAGSGGSRGPRSRASLRRGHATR